MIEIIFMGSVKNIEFCRNGYAEFASRWKKESLARTVGSGKETSQMIAKDIKRGVPRQTAIGNQKSQIAFDKESAALDRNSLNNAIEKSKNKGSFRELTKKKKGRGVPKDVSRVRKAAQNLRLDRFMTRQGDRAMSVQDFVKKSTSNVVNNPNPSFIPQTQLLQPPKTTPKSPSLLMKAGKIAAEHPGKVALGISAAGIGTALGMGMYRKMRSDKGKKRGKYKN